MEKKNSSWKKLVQEKQRNRDYLGIEKEMLQRFLVNVSQGGNYLHLEVLFISLFTQQKSLLSSLDKNLQVNM